MADLAAILATFAFFLIAIAYTAGCDRLGTIGKPTTGTPSKAGKP